MPTSAAKARRRTAHRLRVEPLEPRLVLTANAVPPLPAPVAEAEPNDTVSQALDFSALADGVVGADGAIAAADVDWYTFTLTQPTTVTAAAYDLHGGTTPFTPALTLYHQVVDVYDPYAPFGYRLLDQAEGGAPGETASVVKYLPAGVYWVAVSGAGNRYFNPNLADTGIDGSAGEYALRLTAAALPLDPTHGPKVLSSSVADGAALARSPFQLYLSTTTTLDFGTLLAGDNVRLVYNATGAFGDGNDVDVLIQANYSPMANELQILPLSPMTYGPQPLAVGHYQLVLRGNTNSGLSVIMDVNGLPLGADADNPAGSDFQLTFQVAGVEGRHGGTSDDSPATATDLGDVTTAGLVRAGGAIGDDPSYDPANPDMNFANPAADVDHYRFTITGPGHYGLIAEASAGRFGSPLDAAVALYRMNPDTGLLELVVANDNTLNAAQATDGSTPLYPDAVVYAGLEAGEYYLVVSGAFNVPDLNLGMLPGTNGVYDPNLSHSGANGYSTGDYVLNVFAYPDEVRPQVEEVTIVGQNSYPALPTDLSIRFSENVDLAQLALLTPSPTTSGGIAGVFFRGSDGVDYYPRFTGFDPATNVATFRILDRLPNGPAELHLSAKLGVADLAGNPLLGSAADDPLADPHGDYVFAFTVQGPAAGSNGNPLLWLDQEANDDFAGAQEIGILFPKELQAGVVFRRDFTADPSQAPSDTADYYRFEVLQKRGYFFNVQGTGLPTGTVPEIFLPDGTRVFTLGRTIKLANLDVGTYYVRVAGWQTADAASVKYDLRITLSASNESPTPLTAGPAPAYRLTFRLAEQATPPGNPPPPVSPGTSTPGPGVVNAGSETNGPRLVLPTIAAPSSGIIAATLYGGQQVVAGGPVGLLNTLSEGPVGGIRAEFVGDPTGKTTYLSLPAGGVEEADGVRPAIAEEEAAVLGPTLPRTILDDTFSSLSAMMGPLKARSQAMTPNVADVVRWLSRSLRYFEAAAPAAAEAPVAPLTEATGQSQEASPEALEDVADRQEPATGGLLKTASLVAGTVFALAPLHAGRRGKRRVALTPPALRN